MVLFCLILLMPWILGFALLKPFLQQRQGYVLFSLGAGYVLGWFVITLIFRFYGYLQRPFDIYELAVIVSVAACSLLFIKTEKGNYLEPEIVNSTFNNRLLAALVILPLLYRWGLSGVDLLSKPVFPWDGWYSWSAKAKAFYYAQDTIPLYGEVTPFWNTDSVNVAFVGGQEHPYFVSLIQSVTATAWGSWDDNIVNLPWLGLSVACALIIVGGLRYLGADLLPAVLTSYAVVSLPIFDTHISLGSYADVWVGVALLISAFLLVMLLLYKKWRLLLPLCIFLLIVYMAKNSALVFIAALLYTAVWFYLGARRSVALLVFFALLAILYLIGKEWLAIELPESLQNLLPGSFRGEIIAHNPVYGDVWREWLIYDNWHYTIIACLASLAFIFLPRQKNNRLSGFSLLIVVGVLSLLLMLAITLLTKNIPPKYFVTIFNRASLYFIPVLLMTPVGIFYLLRDNKQ